VQIYTKDTKFLTVVALGLISVSISVFEPTKGIQSHAPHRTSYTRACGLYSTRKPKCCPISSL